MAAKGSLRSRTWWDDRHVLAFACAAVIPKASFAGDLEQALLGQKLTGTPFHRTILAEAKKHGLIVQDDHHLFHTSGDQRGVVLWLWASNGYDCLLFFLWPEGGRNRVQLLERGTTVEGPGTDCVRGDFFWRKDELRIAGIGSASGNWSWPELLAYRESDGRWQKTQAVLMGDEVAGDTRFARTKHGIDPDHVLSRVRVYPDALSACHGCPHRLYDDKYTFQRGQFTRTSRRRLPTPLATLEDLAALEVAGRRREFAKRVGPRFEGRLWEALARDRKLSWHFPQPKGKYSWDWGKRFELNGTWLVSLDGKAGAWHVVSVHPL